MSLGSICETLSLATYRQDPRQPIVRQIHRPLEVEVPDELVHQPPQEVGHPGAEPGGPDRVPEDALGVVEPSPGMGGARPPLGRPVLQRRALPGPVRADDDEGRAAPAPVPVPVVPPGRRRVHVELLEDVGRRRALDEGRVGRRGVQVVLQVGEAE